MLPLFYIWFLFSFTFGTNWGLSDSGFLTDFFWFGGTQKILIRTDNLLMFLLVLLVTGFSGTLWLLLLSLGL
jgi:hypothetical protein